VAVQELTVQEVSCNQLIQFSKEISKRNFYFIILAIGLTKTRGYKKVNSINLLTYLLANHRP